MKEYIMRVNVDEDGHEWGLTRVEELIRCKDCVNCVNYLRHRFCNGNIVPEEGYCYLGTKGEDNEGAATGV